MNLIEKIITNPNALNQYLEIMGEDGKEFVEDIINTFLIDAPLQFTNLEKSLAENDTVTFRRVAHTLKTGVAIVGAERLSKKLLELEHFSESGNLSSVKSEVDYCKMAYQILEKELLEMLKNNK